MKLKAIKVPAGNQYSVRVTHKSDSPLGHLLSKKEADELIEFIEAMPDFVELVKSNAFENSHELNVMIEKLKL